MSAISWSSGPVTSRIVRVANLVKSAVVSSLLCLDDADIDILFEQVRGKTVPSRVRAEREFI